jgi:hypothetical protein
LPANNLALKDETYAPKPSTEKRTPQRTRPRLSAHHRHPPAETDSGRFSIWGRGRPGAVAGRSDRPLPHPRLGRHARPSPLAYRATGRATGRSPAPGQIPQRHRHQPDQKRPGPVWQPGYHDHALRREEDLVTVSRYLVANPLRAGLVAYIGNYPLWDAIWFDGYNGSGGSGLAREQRLARPRPLPQSPETTPDRNEENNP